MNNWLSTRAISHSCGVLECQAGGNTHTYECIRCLPGRSCKGEKGLKKMGTESKVMGASEQPDFRFEFMRVSRRLLDLLRSKKYLFV